MRIGTWNLEGRWSMAHRGLLESLSCDALLLTEVPRDLALPAFEVHAGSDMGRAQRWSAIATRRSSIALTAPHPATVAVRLDDTVLCCSVLPWPFWRPVVGVTSPWHGRQSERMADTCAQVVSQVGANTRLVWGGDWNTPLTGSLQGFNRAAQRSVLDAVELCGLTVPTAELESATQGCRSIDHIAVPRSWQVGAAEAIPVPTALSDHWAYVVEADARP